MTLHIHFLRHGQTESSRDNVFCGSGLNPGLTPDGHDMATAFAAAYGGVPWKAIYAGPLKRTVEAAEPISRTTGIPVFISDDLKEIGYGDWEGKSVEEVERDYRDDYRRWLADPASNAPTGGETAIALLSRSLRFVETVTRQFTDGNVIAVSHKATIRSVLCGLLGLDVGRYRYKLGCPVGSLSVVEITAYGPLLHRLADRAHLDLRLRELKGT
jgi:probable phosphoglycerate mutase